MTNAHSVIMLPGAFRRSVLWLALFTSWVCLFSAPALAANRVVWKQTKIEEVDKSWKVALEVYLDRAPDVAHMPVRFSFTAMSYFERARVDGHNDPVKREIPLSNQQPIVESVDIGFLDPGTGKAAKRTRFSFHVTRDRGFEAGTYEVVVTDARSDREFGGKAMLTLNGENEVIDRRSMVFDDKPKPKQESGAPKAEDKERELTPDDAAYWAGGPKQPEEKKAPLPPPAHMQERPGCGCRVGGPSTAAPAWALAALGLCLFVRRVRQDPRGRAVTRARA